MPQRRVALMLGGGFVLIALVLLLSTVPVIVHKGKSTVSHVEGSDFPGSGACVAVTFDATFDYSVARPLLDLWSFAEVRDLTIDHVHMTGAPDPSCSVAGASVDQVTDSVVLPNCDGEFSDASSLVQSGRFTDCDGNAAVYAAEPVDGRNDVDFFFEVPLELPNSGVIRAPWCPEFRSSFSAGSVGSGARADTGDLCLDLS